MGDELSGELVVSSQLEGKTGSFLQLKQQKRRDSGVAGALDRREIKCGAGVHWRLGGCMVSDWLVSTV